MCDKRCALSAVSGHALYCLQSLVIPCIVCSLWSSPVQCPQSLVHLLYYVRSLWSYPVLCPQCLVTSCTMSVVHWFRIFFFLFFSS
ncbi:unnamed protein product, partial [Staurois parvus]